MIRVGKYAVGTTALLAIMGYLYTTGGCVGEWCVYRKSDGPEMRGAVMMSRVIDGDTFEIGDGKNGRSSEGETIRLIDMNAPELTQCFGVEAKDALERLLRGNNLAVTKDISGEDAYGRLLRYVTVQTPSKREKNILVNVWMVENGFATYSPSENGMFQREMVQAQNDALARRAGLWGACSEKERAEMGLGKIVVAALPPSKDCVIKGNIADNGGDKRYFLPTCKNYTATTINTNAGERYFCSEAEAEKAGWRKSEGCK